MPKIIAKQKTPKSGPSCATSILRYDELLSIPHSFSAPWLDQPMIPSTNQRSIRMRRTATLKDSLCQKYLKMGKPVQSAAGETQEPGAQNPGIERKGRRGSAWCWPGPWRGRPTCSPTRRASGAPSRSTPAAPSPAPSRPFPGRCLPRRPSGIPAVQRSRDP